MEHLKIDPNKDNKFIYQSDEPCVLPSWDSEESSKPPGSSPGESPNKTPSNTPGFSTGASGPLLGSTGTQVGKENGGAGTNYNRSFRLSSKVIQKSSALYFLLLFLGSTYTKG